MIVQWDSFLFHLKNIAKVLYVEKLSKHFNRKLFFCVEE